MSTRYVSSAPGVAEQKVTKRLYSYCFGLERIDRAFTTVPWLEAFPQNHLRSLSSECSDHAPLLLRLQCNAWAKPRFRFEGFWVRLDGFDEVVRRAWAAPISNVDACRVLNIKFRLTAKALKNWSRENVGSVRLQLFMARELIAHLDVAQEQRELTDEEWSLRKDLKRRCLGLASMSRTIARHRSRIRYWEREMRTRNFFHLQACHRGRKNYIPSVQHEGQWFSDEEAKADLIFEYYNSILGKPFRREHALHLDELLPRLDLLGMDACFTEDEI